MKGENPFTLTFGKVPACLIPRTGAEDEIAGAFCIPRHSYHACIVTGVQGSGKTVLLSRMAASFRERPEQTVADLNSNRRLLRSLAAKLSSESGMAALFAENGIDCS